MSTGCTLYVALLDSVNPVILSKNKQITNVSMKACDLKCITKVWWWLSVRLLVWAKSFHIVIQIVALLQNHAEDLNEPKHIFSILCYSFVALNILIFHKKAVGVIEMIMMTINK